MEGGVRSVSGLSEKCPLQAHIRKLWLVALFWEKVMKPLGGGNFLEEGGSWGTGLQPAYCLLCDLPTSFFLPPFLPQQDGKHLLELKPQ